MDGTTTYHATFHVTGMTCGHCVASVRHEIGALPGVTDVAVDLVLDGTSTVTVDATEPLDVEAVRQAIDEAGYQLADA
ncbi:MAG TPA: heavy metal-associated domain-containing protein [Kineosporiaceae bacterium]|nr:heavy metal-associated domain-containing protein [Kineosporiaceae bacterium]